MRRVLTRIIVVSGINMASAFQVEEANSSEEESLKQHVAKIVDLENFDHAAHGWLRLMMDADVESLRTSFGIIRDTALQGATDVSHLETVSQDP